MAMTGQQNYVCCLGMWQVCCLKDPCPPCCLCLEVFCCPFCAVSANRYAIQDHLQVKNSCCDTAIIWCTFCCQCLICILQLLGEDVDDSLQNAADLLSCIVMGCMLTQQDYQIPGRIDDNPYTNHAPATQRMSAGSSQPNNMHRPPQQQHHQQQQQYGQPQQQYGQPQYGQPQYGQQPQQYGQPQPQVYRG